MDSGAASPLVAVPAVHDGVQPSRVAVRGRAEAELEPDHRAEVVRGECDGGGVGALEVPRRRAVVGERAHERLEGARSEVECVGVLRVVDEASELGLELPDGCGEECGVVGERGGELGGVCSDAFACGGDPAPTWGGSVRSGGSERSEGGDVLA